MSAPGTTQCTFRRQVLGQCRKDLTPGKKSIFTISASPQRAHVKYSCLWGRAGLMKWAVENERRGGGQVSESADSQSSENPVCALSLQLSLRQTDTGNLHAFFMTRVGWQALSLSRSLSSSPLTFAATHTHARAHTHTQTESNAHHHTFFQPQLSYLPKPSKTISLTNSLPNSEWHFILRRRRGQKDTELDKRR